MTTLGRNERRILEKGNAKQSLVLRPVPRYLWPDYKASAKLLEPTLIEVWRSRDFLVQVYAEQDGYQRLSVCRSRHDGETWNDAITWDELMLLKRECGRGEKDALEVYPADRDTVNVANMRHLWLPLTPVWFAWRRSNPR